MNVNLNKEPLKKFKFGRLVNRLYSFEVRWYDPGSINQPYEADQREVRRFKKTIKANQRVEPVVVLRDYGIVAGIHLLEAFKSLKFKRIPVLYGAYKKVDK